MGKERGPLTLSCARAKWPDLRTRNRKPKTQNPSPRERRLELRESNMEYIDEAMLLCIRESCVLEVDLSDCKRLKEIPVDALCEMVHLERLELKRCDALKWPPIQVIVWEGKRGSGFKVVVLACRVEFGDWSGGAETASGPGFSESKSLNTET